MKHKDFAVFILSHGRADNVKSLKSLKKGNYSGRWYIVIDNEDKQAREYYKKFGKEHVVMFDKLAISKTFDTADNFEERRTVVYARNACFEIAKELGIRYFLELDDDYTLFSYRVIRDNKFTKIDCKQLDELFDYMLDFLDKSGALTIAFAQGGDFIGGKDNNRYHEGLIRKAMNTFFCDTTKYFQFVGRVNEDVNTYVVNGIRGNLLFTVTRVAIDQPTTQSQKGGMTEQYIDSGTYLKSFYSVMYAPSCVSIGMMGDKHKRIHHKVSWNNCTPKIISSKYKKGYGE